MFRLLITLISISTLTACSGGGGGGGTVGPAAQNPGAPSSTFNGDLAPATKVTATHEAGEESNGFDNDGEVFVSWNTDHTSPEFTHTLLVFSSEACKGDNLKMDLASDATQANVVLDSDGPYSFRLITKNDQGTSAESFCSETILVDTEAPQGGFVINNDAETSPFQLGHISVLSRDASEIFLSTESCDGEGEWHSQGDKVSIMLSRESGINTVYGKLRDMAGNTGECLSDSIERTNLPPSTPMVQINGGDATTLGHSVFISFSSVTESDTEMYITSTPDCMGGGSWQAHSPSINWNFEQNSTGSKTLYVKYRALNEESECTSASIHLIGNPVTLYEETLAPERYLGSNEPSMVALDDGRYLAVWEQHREHYCVPLGLYGDRSDIWSGIFDGQEWTELTRVDIDRDSSRDPRLVKNKDGSIALTWLSWNPPVRSVHASIYANGNWGMPEEIETSLPGQATDPILIASETSDTYIVWRRWEESRSDLWAAKYDGSWSEASRLDTGTGTQTIEHKAAINSDGKLVVVWKEEIVQEYADAEKMWANYYGNTVGTATQISIEADGTTDMHGFRSHELIAEEDGTGSVVIAWHEPSDHRLREVRFNTNTDSFGSASLVSVMDTVQGSVLLGLDGNGRASYLWNSIVNDKLRTFIKYYNTSFGGYLEGRLDTLPDDKDSYKSLLLPADNGGVLACYDSSNVTYCVNVSPSGVVSNLRTFGNGDFDYHGFAIVTKADGERLFVLTGVENGSINLYITKLTETGFSEPQILEHGAKHVERLFSDNSYSIVLNADEEPVVIWAQENSYGGFLRINALKLELP